MKLSSIRFSSYLRPAGEPALILQAENLLYTVPEEEYQYGLSLLRKAIGAYEAQKGIPLESQRITTFVSTINNSNNQLQEDETS